MEKSLDVLFKDIEEIRISQEKAGRLKEAKEFPEVFIIDTVGFCNLRCSMCPYKIRTRKKGIMSWDLYQKIIDEIAKENSKARVWLVDMGEPFVLRRAKPSIFDFIKHAKKMGLQDVVLNTNGYLLDEETMKKTIDSGLDGLYIGIDATSEDIYNKIRVKGDFHRVINNVLKAIELKEKLGVKKPELYVQFVEMEENRHQIKDFINFWKDKPINIKIRPKASWANTVEAKHLIYDNKHRFPCYYIMKLITIFHDGKVPICPMDWDGKVIVGDVSESSIKDVWKNSKLKIYREYHKNKEWEKLPPVCRDCRDWQALRADYIIKEKVK